MKTKLWILGCVFFITCCTSDEKPEHILSKEQMVGLMIDMQIAQTRVNDLRLKSDSAREVYDQYHAYLLEEHVVNDSVFYKSLEYYLNRPIDLNVIHEGVLDTLNFRLKKKEAQEGESIPNKEEEDTKPIPTKIS